MSIYTHFRHFLLINTHIIHIFSILNLNNMLNNLVLKYAYGLEKPKNVDKKWNIHGMTCIYSLLTHLSLWGWQVCYWHCLFHPWTSSQRARCNKHVFFSRADTTAEWFSKMGMLLPLKNEKSNKMSLSTSLSIISMCSWSGNGGVGDLETTTIVKDCQSQWVRPGSFSSLQTTSPRGLFRGENPPPVCLVYRAVQPITLQEFKR